MHEYVIKYTPAQLCCEQIDGDFGKTSELYALYRQFKETIKNQTGEDPVTFNYNNSTWSIVDANTIFDAIRIFELWKDIILGKNRTTVLKHLAKLFPSDTGGTNGTP